MPSLTSSFKAFIFKTPTLAFNGELLTFSSVSSKDRTSLCLSVPQLTSERDGRGGPEPRINRNTNGFLPTNTSWRVPDPEFWREGVGRLPLTQPGAPGSAIIANAMGRAAGQGHDARESRGSWVRDADPTVGAALPGAAAAEPVHPALPRPGPSRVHRQFPGGPDSPREARRSRPRDPRPPAGTLQRRPQRSARLAGKGRGGWPAGRRGRGGRGQVRAAPAPPFVPPPPEAVGPGD